MLEQILDEAKATAHELGSAHDCIIPVSGGKDSHFQVQVLTEHYGMNPLLVHFNHVFNAPSGLRNLANLSEKSGRDLIVYQAGVGSVRKISRYMLETVGDLTWHYHAGIRTVPFQLAVQRNIPLIVWGEHGFAELTGLVSLEDFVEYTKWSRKEHDMRGVEAHELVGHNGITEHDIAPYVFPEDDAIEQLELRGIYLSNFFDWNAKAQAERVIETWNFGTVSYERDRTFNLYAKIDDHANDVHDYLKYLKFGYGRATDDASMEIRHGRMTREEGIAMVARYDAKEPSTLGFYCDFLGITVGEFYDLVASMRDPQVWEKKGADWVVTDSVDRHTIGPREEAARVPQSNDRALDESNRHLYFNPDQTPPVTGEPALDQKPAAFKVI